MLLNTNMKLRQIFQINRWTTTVFQLSLPIALYLGIQEQAEWYWWAWMMFFYIIVYSLVGNNIGLHRYFTHKHFEVAAPIKYLFAWTGTMSMLGEPMSYAMTHIVHHNDKYTDTALDPHGYGRGLKSILVCFHRRVDISETPVNMRRIVELSQEWGWLHRFFLLFVAVNAGLLYLISWKVFLFLWWIPASISCWGVAGAVITQHWNGRANNGWKHRWFVYYEALHLHHHNYPRAPNTALLPGEIDYTFQASKIFKPKYYWEGQPGHDA